MISFTLTATESFSFKFCKHLFIKSLWELEISEANIIAILASSVASGSHFSGALKLIVSNFKPLKLLEASISMSLILIGAK